MNTACGWFNDEIIKEAMKARIEAMESYVLVYRDLMGYVISRGNITKRMIRGPCGESATRGGRN
jgi:hypothetical protein